MSSGGSSSDSSSDGRSARSAAPVYKTKLGGGQSKVYLRTKTKPVASKVKAPGKTEYMAGLLVQKPPRSYAADKEAQQMRHVATTLFEDPQVKAAQEVQLTRTAEPKAPYFISTNTNAGNARLREIFRHKSVREGVSDLAASAGYEADSEDEFSKRVARHSAKLHQRPDVSTKMAMPPIIPDDIDESARPGLHAERRNDEAAAAGGFDTTRSLSKGTKRRCAHCYDALSHTQQEAGGGPGPEWASKAAKAGGAKASNLPTHATVMRGSGRVTWDVDTESDSDAPAVRKKKTVRSTTMRDVTARRQPQPIPKESSQRRLRSSSSSD